MIPYRTQAVKDAEADAATLLTVVLGEPWMSGPDNGARLIDAYMSGQTAAEAMRKPQTFGALLQAHDAGAVGFAISAARAAFRAVPGLREGGR